MTNQNQSLNSVRNQRFFTIANKGIASPIAILIVVVLAVVVGGIAIWQSKWQIPIPQNIPTPQNLITKPSKVNCSVLEKEIEKEIIKANYCEKDEDCIISYFGCPFACEKFINKNKEEKIRERVDKFIRICGICLYKCPVSLSKELACINNKCAPKPSEELTITTDKREYKQGETVEMIIKNNGNKEIKIRHPFYNIERLIEDNWNGINTDICTCPNIMCKIKPFHFLQPSETYEMKWDQKEIRCDGFQEHFPKHIVPIGKYRAYTTIITIKENKEVKTIYSNEFTIK